MIKGFSETIENDAKAEKGRFLRSKIGDLAATLPRNVLTGKGVILAGKGTIRAGQNV